jgi:hypothetical protein
MRRAIISFALVLTLFGLPTSGNPRDGKPVKLEMNADSWTIQGNAEFTQHLGVPSIELKPGNAAQQTKTGQALLKNLSFRNGTIEYDVDASSGMGAEIGFRRRDDNTLEDFYLRPQPNCDHAPGCIQYAPITHGMLLWDVFPQYQSPAPLKSDGWNHVTLVVSGQRMNVFINGEKLPSLKVGRLEGDSMEGGISLGGPGIFANVVIRPETVDGLSPKPDPDSTAADPRFVRNWQIASSFNLPPDKDPSFAEIPDASASWQPIHAERAGLVNITRLYGLPLPRTQRSATWIKTTITSDKRQTRRVDVGWAREIWVFANGQLVYADKNLYQPATSRKAPDGRVSLQNGSFDLPLNEGKNQVDVVLADNFYGWGLIMHLDDLTSLHLAK